MKIISSKYITEHILARVDPYTLPGEDHKLINYTFLYFHFSSQVKDDLIEFFKNWKSGKLRIDRYPISLRKASVINDFLIENSDNDDIPEYKYIKYDSLNYLKEEPIFENCNEYFDVDAMLLCSRYSILIEAEWNQSGINNTPIIFRRKVMISKLLDQKYYR